MTREGGGAVNHSTALVMQLKSDGCCVVLQFVCWCWEVGPWPQSSHLVAHSIISHLDQNTLPCFRCSGSAGAGPWCPVLCRVWLGPCLCVAATAAEVGFQLAGCDCRRLPPGSSVSLQGGTCFKVRYSRAGQSFEFPILLTGDYRDWELLVAATLVPPLTSWLLMRCGL